MTEQENKLYAELKMTSLYCQNVACEDCFFLFKGKQRMFI